MIGHRETCGICHTSGPCQHTVAKLREALAVSRTVRPCPFCGGEGVLHDELRDGYADFKSDPDAYARFVRCTSCAAQGPWTKNSAGGAIDLWNGKMLR